MLSDDKLGARELSVVRHPEDDYPKAPGALILFLKHNNGPPEARWSPATLQHFFFWTSYKVQLSSTCLKVTHPIVGCRSPPVGSKVEEKEDEEEAQKKEEDEERGWVFSGSAEDFCAGFDIHTLLFTASGPVNLSFLLISFPSCLRALERDFSARRLLIDRSRRQMGAKRRDSGGVGGRSREGLIKLSSFT